MSKIFEQLLRVRGVGQDFLSPKYEDAVNPFLLPEMEEAVARLAQAVACGEKVLVYGDYDVDGVTASTLIFDTLKLAGVKEVEVMLPNRFTDGYGMSEKVVKRVVEGGFSLVVTVDCGSRNHEIVLALLEAGVETIVTDHHECVESLPEAVAVLNPKRRDLAKVATAGVSGEKLDEILAGLGELKELAGVGVAFKLAQALVLRGLIPEGQEKWLLDLVLIGTICDSMRLTGENRRLCWYGFKVLEKTRRPGLKELMRVARVKNLNSEAVGFQLGPRLNAAGRMESAEIALKLLMATAKTEAAKLATELEELNKERKKQQQGALKEIRERGVGEEPVIIEVGEWHEGILGIIAGRLVEEYRRPAFVLGESEEILKGSGRSFGDFSLAKALENCKDEIIGGGGHAEACGVKVAKERIADFRAQINKYYVSLNLRDQERFLGVRADLEVDDLEDLSLELLEEMRGLEPYGEGNAEPVFLLVGMRVLDVARLGAKGEHLRVLLGDNQNNKLKLMQFFAPEELRVEPGAMADVWVQLAENEFRGTRSVEGRILKIA